MTPQQAEALGSLMARSWSRGPTPDVWADVFADLHHGPAEAAYRRLRDTSEQPPTVATFRAAYAALIGTARGDGPECDACADTGWVTDTHHPAHWPGRPGTIPVLLTDDGPDRDPCICNVARPCRCRQGQQRAQQWRTTTNHDPSSAA